MNYFTDFKHFENPQKKIFVRFAEKEPYYRKYRKVTKNESFLKIPRSLGYGD